MLSSGLLLFSSIRLQTIRLEEWCWNAVLSLGFSKNYIVVGRQCFQCSAAFSRGIRKLRIRRTEFKLSGRLRTGAPVYQESRECQLLCEFLMAVEDILLMFWNRFLRVIIENTVTFIVTFNLHNSSLLPRNHWCTY